MKHIKVVLAEPQHFLLQGIIHELEEAPDITVVGTASTGQRARALIQEQIPDVAVTAIQFPDLSGIEILGALKEAIPVIVLTQEESTEVVFEAMMLGARAYLLKNYTDVPLADAIRSVARGDIVMGTPSLKLFVAAVRERMMNPGYPSKGGGGGFTEREREVLNLISKGHSQTTIARMLGLSPATVRTHCRNAYVKLGVKNQASAIREAIRRGVIERIERA